MDNKYEKPVVVGISKDTDAQLKELKAKTHLSKGKLIALGVAMLASYKGGVELGEAFAEAILGKGK